MHKSVTSFQLGLLLFTYLRTNDTVVHFGMEFNLRQAHCLYT
jgi:hypothetical protein